MRTARLLSGLTLAALLIAPPAHAASDQTTISVSANVVGTCKFTSTGTLAFGDLDPAMGGDVTQSGAVDFWCTKGVSYTIIDRGGLYDDAGAKRMEHDNAGITEYLPYTFAFTGGASGTGNGPLSTLTLTYEGGVAQTDYEQATAGAYSDTITLEINP